MQIYLKNNPVKFHADPTWNNRASDFFEDSHHNKKKKYYEPDE